MSTCTTCHRDTPPSRTYRVRARHSICTWCLFNTRTPEHLHQLHALAAPHCTVQGHDHWNHLHQISSAHADGADR